MKNEIIEEMLILANKAKKKNEIPVSAVITKNNKIYAKAYNKKSKSNDLLGHAEILAIKKAIRKNKDWRLDSFEMYTTMKPCKMCEAIINESRIKKVYYLVENQKKKTEGFKYIKLKNSCETEYLEILKSFFKKKRK